MRRHARATFAASKSGRRSASRGLRGFGVELTCALAALFTVGCLFLPASASALFTHPSLGTFGSANQPSFLEAQGMAVDQSSGDLLVIEAGAGIVSRYHSDGTPANFSALGTHVIDGKGTGNCLTVPADCDETPQGALSFGGPGEVQIAVDNSGAATDGNIYVTQAGAKVVDIFGEDGGYLGQLTETIATGEFEPCGVAVDPSGNVYVGNFRGGGNVHKYEPTANPPVNADNNANFPFASSCTLAAGDGPTADSVFPAHYLGSIAKVDSASGVEKYEAAPGSNTTETVNPATGHLYTATGNEVKEYDASGESQATLLSSIAPGGEEVRGIAVDKTTGNVYLARKGNSQIEVWGPAVLLPNATTEAAVVSKGSVTLHGTVNADEGPPATCLFEYVELPAKGFEGATSVPCSPAGPFTGSSSEAVEAQITGLGEGAFRFRLLATNANGSSEGEALLFNTFEGLSLPDGRAYEMVSPAQKGGEVLPPEPSMGYLGGRFTPNCSSGECLPGINNSQAPMQSAPDGEAIVYQGFPFSSGLASGPNSYLSRRTPSGWVTQSLSPVPFASNSAQGYKGFSAGLSLGIQFQIQPALSPEAPAREGESFANLYLRSADGPLQPLVTGEPPNRDPGFNEANGFRIHFRGGNPGTPSSPAFSHLLFEANDALTAAVPGIAPAAVDGGVLVNNGFPANLNLYERFEGQLRLVNVKPGNTETAPGAVLGSGRLLADRPDFENPIVEHAISDDGSRIFWSEEESGQLYVRIDGKETRKIQDPGLFVTASADGSEVLLSDGCLYDLGAETCEDLTQGEEGFEGILGAAEDLSRIYFVDTAALSGAEENANGEQAEEGEFNLYAWDEGDTVFIGILVGGAVGDNQVGPQYGAWRFVPSSRTAQVSADGRYLAFMSRASLTGYDNEVRSEGCKGEYLGGPQGGTFCHQVFVYDAVAGSLSCASCNPSGERPLGQSNLSLIRRFPAYPIVPQPENLPAEGEGRVFFESQDVLSPRDLNGPIQDVYEWEPNGVGGCKQAEGCVSLISSGQASGDSMFLDATPSGDDAFFITRQKLLPRDGDDFLDVYDARVGGGFDETPVPPCLGEACKGQSTAAPELQSPASSTFAGPGNEKQKPRKRKKHRKHKKKKRAAKHNRGGQK